jgi:hypothetical protein
MIGSAGHCDETCSPGNPTKNRGREEEEDRLRSTFSERLYPRL